MNESDCTLGNHTLDALWLKEAEDCMEAWRAGELAAVDVYEVFAKFAAALSRKPLSKIEPLE
uniref:Uncharacterized protein n=1 Tax=Candidatus Kentrum sp. FW TaxID=2126338 RepID=A0A450TPE4_9GAMM|nr:MAG: hypothetical protein BECKFW1821C_GA0114237_102011 [Candidatus Kentron sp. FW]